MIKRKPVVGISLKMYQTKINEAKKFAEAVSLYTGKEEKVEQFYCPSMGVVYPVSEIIKNTEIGLGSQNIAPIANGALTGEFSIETLQDMGGAYVEIGHCERREHFNESDKMIREKILLTLAYQMTPVLCIGEMEKSSKSELKQTLARQIFNTLRFISTEEVKKVIIAYEPIWAVGKALAASAPYVHQSHQLIREILRELFSEEVSGAIRVIYGGSVSQENVSLIVSNEDVDGVFVGRFGHDPARYQNIVNLVKKIKEEAIK